MEMHTTEYIITGRALLGEELTEEDVCITVADGVIRSVEPCSGIPDRWIALPSSTLTPISVIPLRWIFRSRAASRNLSNLRTA
ncbi:MAG: hypothetical protein RQM90_02090 [Methanoculleus sp.]